MKHFIKLIIIIFCLSLPGKVLAQKKLINKRISTKQTATKTVVKINVTQKTLKPYNQAKVLKKIKIPNPFGKKYITKKVPLPIKTIDINQIFEDSEWGWGYIHKIQTKDPQYIKGKAKKTNVHYFKNIKKGVVTGFVDDFDHIIVTDTLFAPTIFINTDGKPRRTKRSYIKIIANCIIYEKPIKTTSTMLHNKTDYVFSAGNIFFKTKNKDLKKMKVSSSPPFVTVAYGKIQLHKDPFIDDEKVLVNRLFIEIMNQINRELTQVDNDWEKDKLLIEFQKYRHKVDIDKLRLDPDYDKIWRDLTNNFDSNQESALERIRTENGLKILVEGKVKDLDKNRFKYYAMPSKATLTPLMDENTGSLNKLGDLLFKDTGDSKLSLTMDVKLGYQKELFEKANKELNAYGFSLEKGIPKKILFIDEQPLKIQAQTTGKIVSIDNYILQLKLELQDENLSLIKLFARSNQVTFDINFKAFDNNNSYPQKILFEVPDNIIKQIDFENMIGEFNVIESNTITDLVKITSNLKSDLGADAGGLLNYIEISLEFLFDNGKVVFRGPFKMSSASVLGSEKSILFIKHSEDYSIKISGKAYYDNGIREIKDNHIITSPFIELEEGMFKNATNN